MAVERVHTYCAQSKSRCGVVCTVEDGVLKKVEADPEHDSVPSFVDRFRMGVGREQS